MRVSPPRRGSAVDHVAAADDLALELRVAGVGDVAAAGDRHRQGLAGVHLGIAAARDADLDIVRLQAAGGDVDAGGLQSDDVEVSIAGSGDAKVNASKTLSVTIAGSGDVTYTCDAKLKRKVVG